MLIFADVNICFYAEPVICWICRCGLGDIDAIHIAELPKEMHAYDNPVTCKIEIRIAFISIALVPSNNSFLFFRRNIKS